MAMAGADSDDELKIVKENPASWDLGLGAFYRLLKKPKVEGDATTSAMGEATSAGNQIQIRSAPSPPLRSDFGFYKNVQVMKNLEARKLLGFLAASLVVVEIQDDLLAEFVASYQLGTRVGIVRGKRLHLTTELVSRVFKLPNCGVSCMSLSEAEYPIGGCFFNPNPCKFSIEGKIATPVRVLKTQLTTDWREMVEFVQRWLFLNVDPAGVELGVVVATVALFRHCVCISWSKLVARRLHQLVLDAKMEPVGGEILFHGGYHIMKIFNEVNAIDPSNVKMEADEVGSQSVLPAVPSPLPVPGSQSVLPTVPSPLPAPRAQSEVQCVVPSALQGPEYYSMLAREASTKLAMISAHPTIFEDYEQLKQKYDLLIHEHQLLQTEVEQLKNSRADAAGEHAAMVDQLKQAMADSAGVVAGGLLQQLKEALPGLMDESEELRQLRFQLEICKAEALDQKKKYAVLNTKHIQTRLDADTQAQKLEELTVHSENLQRQLLSDRKGHSLAADYESPSSLHREAHITIDGFWELSSFIPPAQNLEQAYTYDRQLFFMLTGLTTGQTLSQLEFEQVWEWACEDKAEDLLVEILVRGDLKLEDYVAAYWWIGDLGVRLLRYYRQLEEIQQERRRLEIQCAAQVRTPKCAQWGKAVASELATNWANCEIEEWQSQLQKFLDEFQSEGWLLQMIKYNQARLVKTRFTDVHPSEYFYTYRDTKIRLERLVKAKTFSQLLPFEVHSDAQFKNKYNWQVAPEVVVGMPAHLDSWSFGTSVNITDDQFLGKWENLFGILDDRSDTLLWEALLWIGKDYNHEQAPLCKPIEALISAESNLRLELGEVPEKVAENPYFCSTSERRYKWRIDARLDTVWYNWLVITGRWGNWMECVTSYCTFWQEHKTHQDPVRFRAAIFCKALAEWCQFFKIVIDPWLGARMLQDGELYARLNYNYCRKMRLLELMFMMQFLQGAHHNLIGDKKATRKGAMDSFLHRDRDGTLKEERAKWRDLSLECDKANEEAIRRGECRRVWQMPLQWSPGYTLQLIPHPVSSKSAKPAKKEATGAIGTSSKE